MSIIVSIQNMEIHIVTLCFIGFN